jgi:benzoyl-CoA reductase/2-hydroxyglutaryl-CoA dehydratase subunit BcrC/BadD/HgdB
MFGRKKKYIKLSVNEFKKMKEEMQKLRMEKNKLLEIIEEYNKKFKENIDA